MAWASYLLAANGLNRDYLHRPQGRDVLSRHGYTDCEIDSIRYRSEGRGLGRRRLAVGSDEVPRRVGSSGMDSTAGRRRQKAVRPKFERGHKLARLANPLRQAPRLQAGFPGPPAKPRPPWRFARRGSSLARSQSLLNVLTDGTALLAFRSGRRAEWRAP